MQSTMYCLLSVLLLTSQIYGMEAMLAKVGNQQFPTSTSANETEVHIVYLGGVGKTTTTNNELAHISILSQALGSMEVAADSILYSYTKGFNGFAAVLSASHVQTIRGVDGVVSVFKSQTLHPHTTASWEEYLGLSTTDPDGIWAQTQYGNGTIIGMIDSGIWPESLSFNDDGFGPIPSRWNGTCVAGENFDPAKNCNKKLIGAKFYYKAYEASYGNITAPDYLSARDAIGHGTHTSSTAGGSRVPNATFEGLGNGTATGGAPAARLAMYKVCWGPGYCADADILAAMDDAVADGVDVMSISLGGVGASPYSLDSIAIGAFHAVEHGIFVSCSAGNSGPGLGSATNIAPWIFTVGASTINREFQTALQFGSSNTSLNSNLTGYSLNTFDTGSPEQIVYAGSIPLNNMTQSEAAFCFNGTMDPVQAKGKYIVCNGVDGGIDETMFGYGAKGFVAISAQYGSEQSVLFDFFVPNAFVDQAKGDELLEFINSTENPMASLQKSVTAFNTKDTIMAFFSSVGPNTVTMDILKPDITAPGVDILASWSPVASPSDERDDHRVTDFNIISGTSMACPHAAGTAALVKSRHPSWTPAAIKSAIMTTATPLNTSIPGNFALASGAGQINPSNASDPGLIFDLTTYDYVSFLCSIGYNSSTVALISGENRTVCPSINMTVLDLNYPSIYVSSNVTVGQVHNITRTVTNVGPSSGPVTYSVNIDPVNNTDIQVIPTSLNFTAINQQQSFNVIATIKNNITQANFGSITWSDGTHQVRIPVGVAPPKFGLGPLASPII